MRKIKKFICALMIVLTLVSGSVFNASAYYGGNRLHGASSYERWLVFYDGAAWNYWGSGYRGTWYKYHRNGRTLQYKVAYNGRVSGTVVDDLFTWGEAGRTKFNWNHIYY